MLRRIFFYFDWYFSSVKCFGIIDVVSQNFDRRIATTLSEEWEGVKVRLLEIEE